MRKKFKTKKKRIIPKVVYIIFFIIIGFIISIKIVINKTKSILSPEEYMKYILKIGFNNQVNYNDIKSPLNIPIQNLSYTSNNQQQSKEPIIYIYNTHDEETYSNTFLNLYNITPNVKIASYYLQEKLNDLGLTTIVEDRKIKTILQENNWVYKYSYKASRIYLEDSKKNNPTLRYFIDLHRDSSVKEKTTTSIDGKDYARILFIVGLENQDYEPVLNNITRLNKLITNKYPNLSRGIYKKSGPGVNGIYNQDFDQNCILIEMGGQYNTIEEVANTIDILAPILYEYMESL